MLGVNMPRIVDREERRRTVADVAAQLVADGGVDAVTVRDVAAKAGTSTAIVSHYFRDKQELLMFTFAEMAGRARARVEAALAQDPSDLFGLCEALSPLDEDRRREWRVWIAFWGAATGDPDLAEQQRLRVAATRATIADAVLKARPGTTRAQAANDARRILALVTGMAAQAVFDRNDWPPARQRRLLRTELSDDRSRR